jgi:hypothetical protein
MNHLRPVTIALSTLIGLFTACAGSHETPSPTPSPTPTPTSQASPDVLTYHYDNARTGVQPLETKLTPSTVSASTFGKLYSFTVDGIVYAQPLFVGGYTMLDAQSHNILFIVTAHGTVYAFDADNTLPPPGYVWKVSLIPSGEESVTIADYPHRCGGPVPESVVIGTPVIDRAGGALYVVSNTRSNASGSVTYIQRIHALNLADGAEKLGGPTVIQASVPGTGDGSSGGISSTVTFDPLRELQRAALVLSGGSVYIAWASHCDDAPYHGWVLGYNAHNLAQQTAVFNDTPNGKAGGIWMGAGGISVDSTGNLYVVSGNGTFDADIGGSDYGDSTLKLAPGASGLALSDYFTPSNQQYLDVSDNDAGTANVMLFPSVVGGSPDRALSNDKTGRLYILDINSLGKYRTGTNGPDGKNGDVQDFVVGIPVVGAPGLFTQPSYFNGEVYVGGDGLPLQAFAVKDGKLDTTAKSATTSAFPKMAVIGGTSPIISANGTAGAIVWALDNSNINYPNPGTGTNILHAYDATNLATELYNSTQVASNRDQGVPPTTFQTPVIADGHVFVAGRLVVAVYGLLNK